MFGAYIFVGVITLILACCAITPLLPKLPEEE